MFITRTCIAQNDINTKCTLKKINYNHLIDKAAIKVNIIWKLSGKQMLLKTLKFIEYSIYYMIILAFLLVKKINFSL